VWTQLIYKDLFPALCRGGMVLWSAKVPKALCQSSYGPFANPKHIKKTAGTSFCVHILLSFEPEIMNTKPLRLRFVSAIFTIVQLFF